MFIVVQDDPNKLTDRQILIIDVLREDHAGEYECRAVNSEGRARDIIFVDVQCNFKIITLL